MPKEIYRKFFVAPDAPAAAGGFGEIMMGEMFSELGRPSSLHYDRSYRGARIEGKLIRAHQKKLYTKQKIQASGLNIEGKLDLYGDDTLLGRALYSTKDHTRGVNRHGEVVPLGNDQFQQVKPHEFDLMLGFVVFLDLIRIYLVPSELISPCVGKTRNGKIPMTPQHPGAECEGTFPIRHITQFLIEETTVPLNRLSKLNLSIAKARRKIKKFL